ncbi:MAG: nuclear transport factor 2 family protein [Candidatus Bathyarchaeota archaeon]|jgi:ketosteroid isomerase-like protein|nr:nuclear transport factor 2 family protein [Candidatus Bathyarchaeota archaeon]
MAHLNQNKESAKVKKVIDDWFNAMSNIDRNGTLAPISDEFVSHMPGSTPFVGREALWGIMEAYKTILGPIYHVESKITVSDSGNVAYEIGRHDHIMYDGSGGSNRSSYDHIIVLKKVDGVWLIDGISETNTEPHK